MAMGPIEISSIEGGSVTLGGNDLEGLGSRFSGPVLLPGDAGWDDSILIWNGMVANVPAVVLKPKSTSDVSAAVMFAADHGLLMSVKGGGHNIAGTSMAPGGLTLDMSLMNDVTVDVEGRQAHAGAGCLLGDVDRATQEHGLAAVLGFVSQTGIAGLTLGGGFGYLTRRFGWTVDNLEEVEIVTADGQVRVSNRQENADLFWGLRGGGGNLGVVTRFSFRLHSVGPMITGGLVAWSAERADDLLAGYRQFTESAPREVTTALTIRLAPPAPFIPPEWHGRPIVGMIVCHSGPNATSDLAPLWDLAEPIVNLVTEKSYVEQQAMLDATQPKGPHYYWKSEFIPGLSPGFVDAFRDGGLAVTSPMSQSVMFHLAGALNELPDDDGAVGNRDAGFMAAFAGSWPPPDPRSAEHVAWARNSWEGIRPFSTGGNYVNFQVADDDPSRTAAAYGANLSRLQEVKAAYDPHNLFRVNRNVTPAG